MKSLSFIDRKFYSLLFAATIEEGISYLMLLTDNIIAGNMIGSDAVAAIGYVTFATLATTFVGMMVGVGTSICFTEKVGEFDKESACNFFSQGVILALAFGFLLCAASIPAQYPLFAALKTENAQIALLSKDYYCFYRLNMIALPLSYVLSLCVFADGDETRCMVASVVQIMVNIVCSIILCHFIGIKGIALSSGIGSTVACAVLLLHFFKKSNSLHFHPYFSLRATLRVFSYSIVDSVLQLFMGVLVFVLNALVVHLFGSETLVVMTIVVNMFEFGSVFDGIGSAMQPLAGIFVGERNTEGMRSLMHTTEKTAFAEGLLVTAVMLVCAPLLVRAFGITDADVAARGTLAVRIISLSMVFTSFSFLFSSFYLYTDHIPLAVTIIGIKEFISPLVLSVAGALLFRTETALWIFLALASALGVALSALTVRLHYGRQKFPLLLESHALRTHNYDFVITKENVTKIVEKVHDALIAYLDEKMNVNVQVLIEEMCMLILEKNDTKKPIYAECTLIIEEENVRLIMRDSGEIFDITDSDARVSSFRTFIVASIMNAQARKVNLTTNGYNRNEFAFPRIATIS